MSPFSDSIALTPDPIARELEPGERVVWSSQPKPARMMRRALPLTFFALPCTAFMLFWMWGASAAARSAWAIGKMPHILTIIFPATGLVGLAIVVLMAFSPWYEANKARHTFYVLTNRRALIIVDGKRKEVSSILPGELSVKRRDLALGGDVVLKQEIEKGESDSIKEIGFFGIENHHEVERMVLELAQSVR